VILAIVIVAEAVPSPYGLHRHPPEASHSKGMEIMAKTPLMHEGDMKLTEEQHRAVRVLMAMESTGTGSQSSKSRRKRAESDADTEIFHKATANLQTRWPGGVVPYAINSDGFDDDDRQLIMYALRHWEMRTCITFEPTSPEIQEEVGHDNYLHFIRDSGCWSYVGMIPQFSEQRVSIGYGCEWLDIIVHEVGHALGFFHEQSRPDRDDYVTIHLDNVIDGMEGNFRKYATSEVITGDVPYDIASVMHYFATAFTNNGEPTITVNSDNPQPAHMLGEAKGLSCNDIRLANIIYECAADGDVYYDCNEEEEGYDYEFDPDGGPDIGGGDDEGYRVEMVVMNTETGEYYWGDTDEDAPANVVTGRTYVVMCWQLEKIRHSNAEDVVLELQFDGSAVDANEAFDDLAQDGDPSSSYGGRPFIWIEYTATAEDHGKVFTCSISSASGGVEVAVPTKSNVLLPYCEQLFDVPCGLECVGDYSILCNGEEDCPGGTDEHDRICDEDRCSGVFTEEGDISSPGFPEDYPNQANCAQLLRAPVNQSVHLSFDEFQVEDGGPNCNWDAVEVFDGPSPDHQRIGKFCSDSIPDDIVSNGDSLLVVFHSDDSESAPGYFANFHFVEGGGGGGRGLRTITNKEFYGGFTGHVNIPIDEDADNWRIKLVFPIRIKSLQISNCEAEIVGRRQKLEYLIENKPRRGGVSAGDRLRFEFTAITSRKQKGAVAEVHFMKLDG